ncbi:MAG: clan AA aspartic protease [Chloroflexota bacterium]
MIRGSVSAELEATIPVRVRADGREVQVNAVIDTGFDGWLTLPASVVSELRLPRRGRERGVLAVGSVAFFHLHDATVIWDGRPRSVFVAVAAGTPLVGMALLEGHELAVRVTDGGAVKISALTT